MTRSNLLATQNYADVIGVIPKRGFKTKPLLFMQDGNGDLLWTSITSSNNNGSLPEDKESAIPKVDFQGWLDQEIFRPHFQTTSELPKAHPATINSFTASQKPTLRWSEIFDDSFFKEAVDVGTDKFHFQIPLVEVLISTAFRVQLELIYDAMENNSPTLVGHGWFLPIARDFISVDFEGSVFAEDAKYQISDSTSSKKLSKIKEDASVAHFELDNISDLQISFEKNHQRWIVETPMERAVYGQDDEAIRWTLAWPYWRGSGKDTNNLKRVTNGWFLSERRSKFTGEAIYYH
jgi:hypothetical protein